MNQSSDEKLYATRIRDGSKVILKKVKRNSDEAEIIRIFSNAAHSSNTANHCVPVYDYFDVPGDEETSVAVMPFIRSRGSVAAVDTVGEAVEVMRQMIEVSERHVPIKGCADGLFTIRVCNSCILCMLRTSTLRSSIFS